MKDSFSKSYADAGVDVTAGYETISRIKPMVEATFTDGVLGTIGGFGGMFDMSALLKMKRPITVSGTDGVGTKLKIAFLTNQHNTVGIDCVAMCVNDIVCGGAKPLFFLDYLAMGKNIPERTAEIVAGIADGCKQAGCALIGGETAEMPGFYPEGEYDLAGFSVGAVDYECIIDGSQITPGDVLIGLSSSGVHSNGFSLVRKVLDVSTESVGRYVPELGKTLGEELLTPTRIYVDAALSLLEALPTAVSGMAHITGGGFYENLPRMLPEGCRAQVETSAYPTLPIFDYIQNRGNIPVRDMYNTFNMGIGFVFAVSQEKSAQVLDFLKERNEPAYIIGSIQAGEKGVDVLW